MSSLIWQTGCLPLRSAGKTTPHFLSLQIPLIYMLYVDLRAKARYRQSFSDFLTSLRPTSPPPRSPTAIIVVIFLSLPFRLCSCAYFRASPYTEARSHQRQDGSQAARAVQCKHSNLVTDNTCLIACNNCLDYFLLRPPALLSNFFRQIPLSQHSLRLKKLALFFKQTIPKYF